MPTPPAVSANLPDPVTQKNVPSSLESIVPDHTVYTHWLPCIGEKDLIHDKEECMVTRSENVISRT